MIDRDRCASPLPWETLVAYWAGDLSDDDEESAELHLLGCPVCTAESQRVAAVTEGLRKTQPRRRRSLIYATAGALALAAAIALFLWRPREPTTLVSYHLPAPVRDAEAVEIAPGPSAREVRLVPDLPDGVTVDGARVRRLEGGWLAGRVEAGPPFAVVLQRGDLIPGRYELQLVLGEEPRGFYRFRVTEP